MKKLAVFLAAILLFAAFLPAERITACAESGVYALVDDYLDRAAKRAHVSALSAVIVDRNGVLLEKQVGRGATADTPFLLGSVSKSFTAACVMQLVEQGKIEPNAPVSRYLPDARDGDRITVRQLLNHTGGLGEHQNLTNYKIVNEQGKHVYANVNYALLGQIVAQASGSSYETYVTQNVFRPLGMAHSAATQEESEANGLIAGHRNFFGFPVPSKPFYPDDEHDWISIAAGYLTASVADLGRYLQMYLRGGEGVLAPSSIDAMFYDGVPIEADVPYSYGFGWTLFNEPFEEPVLRHSGMVETGMSCVYLLPERGIGIALLVNTNDYFVTSDLMDRIGWSIPLLLTGREPDEIGQNEYVLRHLGYDAVYLAVFLCAVLPFFFMKRYLRTQAGAWLAVRIVLVILLHVAAPVFLLLLPRLFFATPLWVAEAFVPDLWFTDVLSAALLFAGGVYKVAFMLLGSTLQSYCDRDSSTARSALRSE